MATPALSVLKGTFENVSVLASPHIQEMLQEDGRGLRFLTPGPQRGFGDMLREAGRLRSERFDIVLLVNRSIRSALTVWFARIPQRVGHATEGRKLLLTKSLPMDVTRFEADNYSDLVRALGIETEFPRVTLTVSAEERDRGLEFLGGADVGVQPGASFEAKSLPIEKLGVVVNRLQSDGHRIAMIGGRGEEASGEALAKLAKEPMVDLIGKCKLRESMGAVAGLKTMIGASTGIMHIAAALGCPTVTVFGETLSTKWGHLYPPHETIQIPTGNMADMSADELYEAAQRCMSRP